MQWAMTAMSASSVYAPVDVEEQTPPAKVAQCQDHLGYNSIGAGSSNQMQLAQEHHLNANLALVLPAFSTCNNFWPVICTESLPKAQKLEPSLKRWYG